MLINTVLVFTRELLPVLLLLSALLHRVRDNTPYFLLIAAAAGLALLLAVTPFLSSLAAMADGNGLELLFACCHSVALVSLVLSVMHRWRWLFAVVTVTAMTLQCGVNLVIYGLGADTQSGGEGFWLGVTLATGIGLSIAVLWYQLLAEVQRFWRHGVSVVMAMMAARQSSELFNIFQQLDWIDAVAPLWNSASVVREQSEIGVFLQALLGYEASPAPLQLLIWLVTLAGVWRLARRKGEIT
jgi:high-affinity iron transporter